MAVSAGAVIFLAGDVREVSEFARIMFHRAWAGLFFIGNAPEARRASDAFIENLESFDSTLAEVMVKIIDDVEDTESAMELLTKEVWYNSAKAIESGLATGKAFVAEDGKEVKAELPCEIQAVAEADKTLREMYNLLPLLA